MIIDREFLKNATDDQLISLFDDENEEVIGKALYFLSKRYRDNSENNKHLLAHCPRVRRFLDHSNPEVRASACEAVINFGYYHAAGVLFELLSDKGQPVYVRDTCAYGLGVLAYGPALNLLRMVSEDKDEPKTVRDRAKESFLYILNFPFV